MDRRQAFDRLNLRTLDLPALFQTLGFCRIEFEF